MGLLIPVVHPVRLPRPADAAALVRALGITRVFTETWRPHDAAGIDRLIAALVPDSETSITFERGTLDDASLDIAACLAVAGGGCFGLTSSGMQLRVWSTHARLYITAMPPGGIVAAAALLARELGVAIKPVCGEQAIGEICVSFETPHRAIDARIPDRAAAYRLFRAWTTGPLLYGSLSRPNARQLELVLPFIHAASATIFVYAELDVATAVALAPHYEGEMEWQADDLMITFPDGEVSTFRLAPVADADAAAWLARIDSALRTPHV